MKMFEKQFFCSKCTVPYQKREALKASSTLFTAPRRPPVVRAQSASMSSCLPNFFKLVASRPFSSPLRQRLAELSGRCRQAGGRGGGGGGGAVPGRAAFKVFSQDGFSSVLQSRSLTRTG